MYIPPNGTSEVIYTKLLASVDGYLCQYPIGVDCATPFKQIVLRPMYGKQLNRLNYADLRAKPNKPFPQVLPEIAPSTRFLMWKSEFTIFVSFLFNLQSRFELR